MNSDSEETRIILLQVKIPKNGNDHVEHNLSYLNLKT